MRAAVISLGSKSSLMVVDALKKYFDTVEMIELKNVEVHLGKEGGIFYEGKPLPEYDCIYAKGSFRYANLLRSLTMLLEKKVLYMPLPADAFTTIHNKLLTHLVLQQHNIPMPRTYLCPTIGVAKKLLEKAKYPIVMKFPEGTQGKGVMFADSVSSAYSLLDALGALHQPFIIQEYIETGGTDIRVLVVGDKVAGAMRRKAQTEEKRANIHTGGVGEKVSLPREASSLAITTAKVLGVGICGVDILESSTGPKVIEANISPGLQELSRVTGIDIADQIALFLYNKTAEAAARKKKDAAQQVLKEEAPTMMSGGELLPEVVTTLQFRGERILLPEFVTRMANLKEQEEYVIKATKGKVEIKEL